MAIPEQTMDDLADRQGTAGQHQPRQRAGDIAQLAQRVQATDLGAGAVEAAIELDQPGLGARDPGFGLHAG
jgi:hypothetical protein